MKEPTTRFNHVLKFNHHSEPQKPWPPGPPYAPPPIPSGKWNCPACGASTVAKMQLRPGIYENRVPDKTFIHCKCGHVETIEHCGIGVQE